MTVTTTRWVLWFFLLILLPLPFYQQDWCWVPVGRIVQLMMHLAVAGDNTVGFAVTPSIVALLLLWSLLLWMLSRSYTALAAGWPDRIRGSIMGLSVFSLLILFSTFRVYQPLVLPGQSVSFLQLYQ